jgi:hypothetical protein
LVARTCVTYVTDHLTVQPTIEYLMEEAIAQPGIVEIGHDGLMQSVDDHHEPFL